MMVDPLEVARYEQDRAQNRLLLKRQVQAAELALRIQQAEAVYVGYDADSETHRVRRNGLQQQVRQLLTNAGLSAGQPVEFIQGALDATPRVRADEEVIDPQVGAEPSWVLILKHRRYTNTVSWFFPPRGPIFSGAQIAKYFVTYRPAAAEVPPGWPDTTYGPALYTEGRSEQLCGDGRPGVVGNFCRTGMSQRWNYRPEPLVVTRRPGFCHLSFARTVPTGFGPGSGFPEFAVVSMGGLVIGELAEAANGTSGSPPVPTDFPRVYESVEGLTCEQGMGAEVPLNWTKIAEYLLVPYSPPVLIDPGRPGGTVPIDRFETVFWGVTANGVQELAVVADDYSDEEEPGGIVPNIEVLPALGPVGQIELDLKIGRPQPNGSVVVERLFTVGGQPVPSSSNWRRVYANGAADPVLHPCVQTFQADPLANVAERELLLYRAQLAGGTIQSGLQMQVDRFRLTAGAQTCALLQPELTVQVQVAAVPPEALDLDSRDTLSIAGFVYFSEGE